MESNPLNYVFVEGFSTPDDLTTYAQVRCWPARLSTFYMGDKVFPINGHTTYRVELLDVGHTMFVLDNVICGFEIDSATPSFTSWGDPLTPGGL